MERQISKGTFFIAAIAMAIWFPVRYVVEIIFYGKLGSLFASLDMWRINFLAESWIPLWIISMGFVPALLSVQNVRTYLRLFAFYFTLFVLIPIVGMYFMWPYSAHSAFPIGSVLLGRTIDCGLAFIVTAAVARVAGNGESSGVPVATERVALSFLKSVWPPALFLFALGAVPFAIGALAGNVLFGLFTLPVMAFGINFGFSTFAFLGGAVVVAWYGQRQWLVWLAFASAVMMVLPKLSTLVYPEGRLIVIGVLFSWALIFWFCKLFLRSLLATAREIYS